MLSTWEVKSSHTHDFLDAVFPSDEAIIEAMSRVEPPWEDLHHRSYFLPERDHMDHDDFRDIFSENIVRPVVPFISPGQMADGNMENLSPTIPINISRDPGKVENVYIGAECSPDEIKEYIVLFKDFRDIFAWSYDDIPGIDPHIVEHEIKTYPDVKLV